jgi:hypothetical protein
VNIVDEDAGMEATHGLSGGQRVSFEDLHKHFFPFVFGLAAEGHAEASLALLSAEEDEMWWRGEVGGA